MKKRIVLLIVSCLILKNAAFAGGIEVSIDTSSPVIQSAVFQVVSILSMPFQMVSKMMEQMPLGQPLKGHSEKKTGHSQDAKCIFTPDNKTGSKQKLKVSNYGGGKAAVSRASAHDTIISNNLLCSPWESLICFLVSVFLILLPRRGPPLNLSKSYSFSSPNCAIGTVGFFIVPQNLEISKSQSRNPKKTANPKRQIKNFFFFPFCLFDIFSKFEFRASKLTEAEILSTGACDRIEVANINYDIKNCITGAK